MTWKVIYQTGCHARKMSCFLFCLNTLSMPCISYSIWQDMYIFGYIIKIYTDTLLQITNCFHGSKSVESLRRALSKILIHFKLLFSILLPNVLRRYIKFPNFCVGGGETKSIKLFSRVLLVKRGLESFYVVGSVCRRIIDFFYLFSKECLCLFKTFLFLKYFQTISFSFYKSYWWE